MSRLSTARTDFSFRRAQLNPSGNIIAQGPLRVFVPRNLIRRKVYASVVWHGFIDFDSRTTLEFLSGNNVMMTLRQRYTSQYIDQRSIDTWGASTGDMQVASGFPSASTYNYDMSSNPTPQIEACGDSIMINGVSNTENGLIEKSYATVMYPFEYEGEMDSFRFTFDYIGGPLSLNSPQYDTQAFIEVYIGCKSFAQT